MVGIMYRNSGLCLITAALLIDKTVPMRGIFGFAKLDVVLQNVVSTVDDGK